MPTLQGTNSSTPLPSTAVSAGVTIAGHVYAPAQIHAFLRGAGVLSAFLLFSYLALVTVPKLALRARRPALRPVHPTRTRGDVGSSPVTPFAPRPPPLRTPTTVAHAHRRPTITSTAKARLPQAYSAHPHQQQQQVPAHSHQSSPPLTPAIWAALAHLHHTADALVGAHPLAVPLAARLPRTTHAPALGEVDAQTSNPGSNQSHRFPWVPATHVFGLVRPHLAPGKKCAAPGAALLFASLPSSVCLVNDSAVDSKKVKRNSRRRPFSLALFNGAAKDGTGSATAKTHAGTRPISNSVVKGGAGKENAPVANVD
ncbi:hypothetical protein B0H19DRAFT_1379962 [Mycena capillaripes]|nr:hypothetical protein B0H19DRAFT_1379962 [Mycena capillaripes]